MTDTKLLILEDWLLEREKYDTAIGVKNAHDNCWETAQYYLGRASAFEDVRREIEEHFRRYL